MTLGITAECWHVLGMHVFRTDRKIKQLPELRLPVSQRLLPRINFYGVVAQSGLRHFLVTEVFAGSNPADLASLIALSFNGKRAASQAVNRGSLPREATKFV